MPEKIFRVSNPEKLDPNSRNLVVSSDSLDSLEPNELSQLLDTLGGMGIKLDGSDHSDLGILFSDFEKYAEEQGQSHLTKRAWGSLKRLHALAQRHEISGLPDIFLDRDTVSYNGLSKVIQNNELITAWVGVEIGPKLGRFIEGTMSSVEHLAPHMDSD